MTNPKALAILNVISFILHLTVTYLTQFRIINKKAVGEISEQYNSLFTPASFSFAIWGIIYTALCIFCLYHIIMAYKRNRENQANVDLLSIGSLFIINNLATAAWLIAWTNEKIFLSVLLIIVQLVTLITIHLRLHIHNRFRTPGSKLATEFPLSLYMGWISIATIANISAWLVSTGWNGWGIAASYWTMAMLVVALILAIVMVLGRRNIAFGLVVIWAVYGINAKLSSLEDDSLKNLIYLGWVIIGLVSVACIVQFIRSFRQYPQKHVSPNINTPNPVN